MKSLKSKAVAAMSVVLAAALLTACGGQSGGGADKGKPSGEKPSQGASTADVEKSDRVDENGRMKETVPLKIMVIQDTNIEDMETNLYTKKVEEKANVDLTFDYLPAGKDARQKLALMLQSQSDLPDLFALNLGSIETYAYGRQGYFIDLEPYMSQGAHRTKDFLETEEGHQTMPWVRSPDNHIYGWPRYVMDIGNDWDHRMWINKTWLDKLGLKMPTTTEEYYEVLKAFKTQDPNGNGKADEYPLLGCTTGWNSDPIRTIMNAFTYYSPYSSYLQVNDEGKIQLAYTQPEFKDGLEYLHKLYAEGLLSELSFTQDLSQFKQIIEDKDAQLLGSTCAGSMSVYQVASERKRDIAPMPPLKGPKGVQYSPYRNTILPDAFGYITSSCKDPLAAAMVFDAMYDRDLSLLARFGEKDVDWKTPEAGAKGLYEELGYKPIVEYINPIWNTAHNKHWQEAHPTLRTYDMIAGAVFSGDPYDSQYMTSIALPMYKDKAPKKIVNRLVYTEEETDEISEILNSLNTYREESLTAFVTGQKALSEWDQYVQEIQNIGAETYLKVAQQAYDRMQAQLQDSK